MVDYKTAPSCGFNSTVRFANLLDLPISPSKNNMHLLFSRKNVLVLGNSGSGKSAFINQLCGRNLTKVGTT